MVKKLGKVDDEYITGKQYFIEAWCLLQRNFKQFISAIHQDFH